MDNKELKDDYANQIAACEQTIQQNSGVIQYCKQKIAQLEKAELEKKPEGGETPS